MAQTSDKLLNKSAYTKDEYRLARLSKKPYNQHDVAKLMNQKKKKQSLDIENSMKLSGIYLHKTVSWYD